MYYLKMFGISLALTILVEGLVGWMFGMRTAKQQKLLALMNVLTNPAAVLLCWFGVSQWIVELGVIVVECRILRSFSGDGPWNIQSPIFLGIALNLISWTFGILLGGIL